MTDTNVYLFFWSIKKEHVFDVPFLLQFYMEFKPVIPVILLNSEQCIPFYLC